jgi:hypothetical protein
MITGAQSLVERTVREGQILAQIALSRCCRVPLQGSATRWCGDCGATVSAADLDHETHAPLRGAS